MAENQQQSLPAICPPTQSANHFAASFNVVEILVTMAQSRVIMGVVNNIQTPQPVLEWLSTLALSPIAAVQLQTILSETISQYQANFGAIPQDPNWKISARENAAP